MKRTQLEDGGKSERLPCPPPRACAGAYRLLDHRTGDKADLCDPVPQAPQPLVVFLIENCEAVASLEAARCVQSATVCLVHGRELCGQHEKAVAIVSMDADSPELITGVAVVVDNGCHDGSRLLQALFV